MMSNRTIALVTALTLFAGLPACESNSSSASPSSGASDRTEAESSEESTPDDPNNDLAADQTEDDQSAEVRPPSESKAEIMSRLPDVIDRVMPAVVGISTQKSVDMRRSPFGPGGPPMPFPFFDRRDQQRERPERKKRGIGSGAIVSEDGTILTNHHVVKGADEITVRMHDDREFDAKVLGTDEATDIAVIQIKEPPENLQPIEIGNSNKLRLGESVVAIGNPFGLSGTVTYGIVSAKGRANVGLADYEDFIQTDAAINPGNSGGPLVDTNGKLVGINTAIMSRSGGYQGIGFAIPSEMAQSVMNKILEHGEVRRGHLGVAIQSLTPELANAFDLPESTEGVVVAKVEEESPAATAGLKRGDVITHFKGKKVDGASQLRNRVARQSPGDEVNLTIRRNGEQQTMTVTLGALHGDSGTGTHSDILDGLSLGSVDSEARKQFRIPRELDDRVVVTDINPDSPAARTGLQPGDVILEANRKEVTSVEDFAEIYRNAKQRVLVLLYRDGNTLFAPIPKR